MRVGTALFEFCFLLHKWLTLRLCDMFILFLFGRKKCMTFLEGTWKYIVELFDVAQVIGTVCFFILLLMMKMNKKLLSVWLLGNAVLLKYLKMVENGGSKIVCLPDVMQ